MGWNPTIYFTKLSGWTADCNLLWYSIKLHILINNNKIDLEKKGKKEKEKEMTQPIQAANWNNHKKKNKR